ncbi:hypothetical protein HYPSUDRAFT_80497 [Hypholoma sublateritium FD-334 SS-4]|uniref:Histone H4 n=1 Tax=Hypholoma sublateritium (strain FD-334 SS-4) TaxID=945553 RepID=A0A0D2NFI7_HYPSF|nr:hypothetical protein HYPSUDRAFT_80497 [Hypholoma sublateritium FD-334 SS-4]
MSGRGKGGKMYLQGLGQSGGKRHRKISRQSIQNLSAPPFRRLARRGGVKRISSRIYEEGRGVIRDYLFSILHDAVSYTDHCDKRQTVTTIDVVRALKRSGKTIYGFDA